jgi:hypothetical protein
MDDIVADLKVMKIKQWTEKVKKREQRRLVVKETLGPARAGVAIGREKGREGGKEGGK